MNKIAKVILFGGCVWAVGQFGKMYGYASALTDLYVSDEAAFNALEYDLQRAQTNWVSKCWVAGMFAGIRS